MRLLITADLHANHARSRGLAEAIIDEMNAAGGDGVLVVGDTAAADGDAWERCLSRFTISGEKMVVAGNHELWTARGDSHAIFTDEWPARAKAIGWRWLETDPLIAGDLAIVGSVGWYDYSFAQPSLGIPKRFYAAKVSPGAIAHFTQFADLLDGASDVSESAMEVVARWNDGKFVKLHRSDETFLGELLDNLRRNLDAVSEKRQVIAAVHHLPFVELLPPPHSAPWDFVKAYLGASAIGELLGRYDNVTHCYCGHSHYPARARVGRIEAINIGAGYRQKRFETLDLPD